jgi:hypothetical protein
MEEHFSLERYAGLAAKILMVVIDSHRPLDLANMQDFDEDQPFEVRHKSSSSAPILTPLRMCLFAALRVGFRRVARSARH